ncbi:sugar transferase [Erythrobacter litoralis]|nr:sugar transferase [Erythrobacter litoralis]
MKRIVDFFAALAALAVLWPVLAGLALLVRMKLGSPVLFRQTRPGLGEELFDLYKFRTMTDDRDPNGNLLPDAQRMTKLGAFLRSTSLDELPSLLNVLKGDLSLVGPRPLLPQYLPLYNERQRRRHNVRPGITGWAQVNGRNAVDWEERFALDIWYVENRSLILDIKIILMTLSKVFRREGISAEGEATMAPFTGTPPADR